MKGLSQTLKDLALIDQTNFSRFLWSASLVSRVEFDKGCLILTTIWNAGTRGGYPIIFKPNWDPNGRKKFFGDRSPFMLGSGWLPPSLIWRSESATDLYLLKSYFYDLNKLRNKWWILDIRRGFGMTGRSKRAEIGTGDNNHTHRHSLI